jgi:site-specific recombinase XerD
MKTAQEAPKQAFDVRTFLQQWLGHLTGYARRSPLTIRAYRADVEKFGHFLEAHRLPTAVDQINHRHVQAFGASLSDRAPATINRALDALGSFFGFLVRSGVVERNPVAQVERPKRARKLPRAATVEQCRALVAAARTPRDRAMVLLLLGTGLRRGELLGLDVSSLSADLSELKIRGKGERERIVPIPGQCRAALGRYLQVRDANGRALFVNRAGERVGTTTFHRWFRRLLRRAGLEGSGLTPHSLRHSYATQLLRAQADLETIRCLLGHSSVGVTCQYLSTDPSRQRAAVERLPEFTDGEVAGDE